MKKSNIPLVSIIIVNWNGIEDTIQCIDSIKNIKYKKNEIIVVDNGSEKDSVKKLKSLNNIKLVLLDHNTGFTGGHLAGLKAARGEYIALLNNDLVVDRNWLNELLDTSIRLNADIVGGKSYKWNDNQPAFNKNNDYSSFQEVNLITGHTFTMNIGEQETLVNSISGSNLLVSRKVIDEIGYLEDYFFAYYEETDLIARAKRHGFNTAFSPRAIVWHKSGESTKNNPYFYFFQMHRNRFFFAYRNFDKYYLKKFRKHYRKESFKSLLAYIKNKDSLYDKALIRAFIESRKMLLKLNKDRKKILKTGITYCQKIISKEESNYTVTIAIPCYNYSKYVVSAIESAVTQTVKPAEIIIINDGSTDNSSDVIKKFIKNYTGIVPINFINQNNKGLIATKNIAINMARTPWLIFLDADDILTENYIEETLLRARETNADVVYTDMEFIGSTMGIQKVKEYNKYLLRSVNFIHNSSLYNTSVLKNVSGYSDYMSDGFEDWELNLKISKITNRFEYINEPLLMYRRHDSASRDATAQQKIPLIVKRLEAKHPDLYNLNYYLWLETYRVKDSLLSIMKYPFYVMRHIKSHLYKKVND